MGSLVSTDSSTGLCHLRTLYRGQHLWHSLVVVCSSASADRTVTTVMLLYVLLPLSSTVEVASSPLTVCLGPELAFQLHQAPDPRAVGAEVGLDVGGRLTDGGQVDAEQLRAPLQRRRDRPAQVEAVPGPHRTRLSNTSSKLDQQRYVVRQGCAQPGWAALGPQLSGTWGTTEDSRG
jgi:hypothetical protein